MSKREVHVTNGEQVYSSNKPQVKSFSQSASTDTDLIVNKHFRAEPTHQSILKVMCFNVSSLILLRKSNTVFVVGTSPYVFRWERNEPHVTSLAYCRVRPSRFANPTVVAIFGGGMVLYLAFALLVMGVAGVQSAIIREPAIIVSEPSAPLLSEGSRLSISCAAYGYPLPTITWSSDALGVTDFAAVEGNNNTIRVYNTTYEDNSGNVFVISILELCDGDPMYLTDITCSADNELNPASDFAVVNTVPTGVYAPVIVASQNSSSFPLTGSRLSLTCAAWGSPAPQITWSSEGGVSGDFDVYQKEIRQTGGEILVVSVLELCDSSLVDYYKEYSCTANSKLDQRADNSTFTLNPFVDIESIGFEYKPSTGLLKMLFSGPVDIEYINCDQRQFTYFVAPSKMYTPLYPGDCFQSSEKEITFSLDIEDYAQMLNVNGLFQSVGNVTFAWSNTVGAAYNIIPGQLVLSRLEPNTAQPSLQFFDIDMSEGVITLFFDSVMDFNTLAPHHLTLQAGRNTSYPQLNITQGQVLSSTRYGTTLCLALYADQLQYLRNGSELCNSTKTCYISFTPSLIADAYGNHIVPVAPTEPIQASKYRPSRIIDEGSLRVELWYIGCVRNIQLHPNEVFIIRPSLRESVRSVGCDFGSNTQLTWKQGGQNRTMSPFINSPISSFDFPHGLSPENYGVFVCTWNNGNISRDSQNYIVNDNPFIGSPDGSVVMQTLYNPIALDVHYGAVGQVYDSALVYRVGGVTDSSIEVSLKDFYLSITVGYTGVVYSLSGHYVANITTTMGYPDLLFEFLIEVQDPTVEISTNNVEIEEKQQSLSLFCNPSSPYLPITWREGNNKLTSDDAGIVLNPPNLSHQLNIDLNIHSLTGQDIVCEVMDPEGLRGVLTMASAKVVLLSGLYCESDRDSQWNILWNRTLAGVAVEQDCPQQSQDQPVSGSAKRKCLESGIWEDSVDVSDCANVEISNLAEQVEIALSTSDIAARDQLLSDLLQDLAEELAPSDTLLLFAQDLSTSSIIVENVVSKLTKDIESRVSSRLQTDVIDVINNLLDENTTDIWMRVENTTDGSQLLQNTESYASYVAQALSYDFIDTTKYGDSITFKRHNIDVAAQVLDATYEDIVYPADEDEASENAQIQIPAAYLSSRNATAVVNILFSNLERILPNEDIESVQPASMVLSSQVIASRRTENINVQLHFKTFSIPEARNPRCVYWDFNARQWLTQGIETKEILELGSYSYQVTCESTHLTAFAVIVDTVQEDEVYELPLIGYIGGGVLVGCALISLVAFLICIPLSCLDKKRKAICLLYFIYFGFFLTVICAGVVFLAGLSEATKERVACAAVAALLQYLFTTALCWILVATFLSIMMMAVKDNTSLSNKWCALFLVFAFGLPVLPTTISVGLLHKDYGNENFCWIRIEKNEIASDILWANAAPMIAIAVAILLTAVVGAMFSCLKYLRTVHATVQHKKCFCSALYIQATSILLTLFVSGTWTFGLLMVNDIWDPSKWLFLGFTAALGVVGLFGSIICLCGSKIWNYDEEKKDDSEKYWSDTRPILKETGQAQTAYALKQTGQSESAYALMNVASDTSVENMMEEPAKKTDNEATSST